MGLPGEPGGSRGGAEEGEARPARPPLAPTPVSGSVRRCRRGRVELAARPGPALGRRRQPRGLPRPSGVTDRFVFWSLLLLPPRPGDGRGTAPRPGPAPRPVGPPLVDGGAGGPRRGGGRGASPRHRRSGLRKRLSAGTLAVAVLSLERSAAVLVNGKFAAEHGCLRLCLSAWGVI